MMKPITIKLRHWKDYICKSKGGSDFENLVSIN